jgi:uncharacterized protein GlcG (DUF336 family)
MQSILTCRGNGKTVICVRHSSNRCRNNFIASAIVGLLLFPVATSAQVITQRNVSTKMALEIVEGAMEQCAKDGFPVDVVVVDRAGQVVAMIRGDGTQPHNLEFARRKAYTSRTFRQTTAEFVKRTETQPSAGLRNLPDIVWSGGGGAPIKVGAETIGGVGVSGAPGGSGDDVCAAAGIARVANQLK